MLTPVGAADVCP